MNTKSNILSAIINLYNTKNYLTPNSPTTHNRINDVGSGLEDYVRDLFLEKSIGNGKPVSDIFSYLGQKNHPPDLILRDGDALEIKKIESINASSIQLNSSYPRDILYANDEKITDKCKNCEIESWIEKDIFYVIGFVKSREVKSIFFVQGNCIAASYNSYIKLYNAIKDSINTNDYEFEETNEFAKLKKIDPLGYTNLRIRGMYELKNPYSMFDFCKLKTDANLSVFCLMTDEKYLSFDNELRNSLNGCDEVDISTKKIPCPNNPGSILECKFIQFHL